MKSASSLFMFLFVFLLFLTSFVKSSIPVGIPTDEQWMTAKNQAIAFINQLTLPEIVSIGTGVNWAKGTCVGNTPNITRVNYAGLCLQDSPTGVRLVSNASAFPAAINAASTWNRSLIYERGSAMGAEFRGKGVNIALAPMMNLGRVAAGGRNWEGFGGDPYLQGVAAYESILGIQSQGVIACAKHFIGNEQEHSRDTASSDIGERAMRELYAWPFYKSVQAGVGSVMCSYNKVNGTWACENNHTQNQILKEDFGFRGFLMSDWGATHTTAFSVNSGLDMTMPGGITFESEISAFGPALVKAVNVTKSVTVDRVKDMAVRILTTYFLFGQDKDFPAVNFDFRSPAIGTNVNVQSDHYKIIRKIGADSNVLLKNSNNVLPLSTTKTSAKYNFAVIGSDAGAGNGPNSCADHGCDSGTLAQGWGSGTSNFPYLVTPLDAITKRAAVNSQSVVSSIDSDWNPSKAAEVATSADVAIVCVKANSGEAYITVDNNQGDRNNLSLWDNGDALIQAVAKVNSKTVVVLHVVGPVLMPWIDHPNVTAVVLAGLPGQESGNSLADVLFGDVNPSGKLVYTIAKNRADYAADVVYGQISSIVYNEGLFIDYRWFDAQNIQPQFPFGFGLSYTTFDYLSLVINSISPPRYISTNGKITESAVLQVIAKITNSGKVDGEEVVQLYLQFPPAANQPPKILRGFDKVFVSSGQSALANFELTDLEISCYDVAQSKWRIYPGSYQILIGSNSRSLKLNGYFQISNNGTIAYSTTGTGIASSTTTTTGNSHTTSSLTSSTSGNSSTSARVTTTSGAEGIVKTNVFAVALFLVLQMVVIAMFA